MIATVAAAKQGSSLGSLVILLPLVVAFYFVGIRPGQLIIVNGGTLCSSNFVFRT